MGEITVVMDREEAERTVQEIRSHLNRARQLLLELYEREGWRALGYESFADCIDAEFKQWSRSYLYRQLATAQLEDGLSREVGDMRESHARAVLEIMGDDKQGIRETVELAETNPNPTARDYKRAALETWVRRNTPAHLTRDRMDAGEISAQAAYEIGRVITEIKKRDMGPKRTEAWLVIECVSDSQLAKDLLVVQSEYPSLWQEILRTGSIPYDGESVPLKDATYTQLRAWVTMDNAEARAQFVENNRAYYDSRNELVDIIVGEARSLCGALFASEDKDTILGIADRLSAHIEEFDEIDYQRIKKHGDEQARYDS